MRHVFLSIARCGTTGATWLYQRPKFSKFLNNHKKNPARVTSTTRGNETTMFFPITLAAASGSWQAASQQHTHEQSPDAIRLTGPTWCSSGITLGTTASAYVGDGWHRGQVVATGVSWATIATTRYGTHRVADRRNLLLVPEAAAYKKALAKWRRDHRQPDPLDPMEAMGVEA
jgi:hypothetical protein